MHGESGTDTTGTKVFLRPAEKLNLHGAKYERLMREYQTGDGSKLPDLQGAQMLDTLPDAGAVVHLHSTWATALSCLTDTDPDDCVPPLTPYVVMRVGPVKLLPYVKPGDPRMGEMIRNLNGRYNAVLLANHGPVVAGRTLASAVAAAEELEETCKLLIALRGLPVRMLSQDDVAELHATFGRI